jgi:hypothetical protein
MSQEELKPLITGKIKLIGLTAALLVVVLCFYLSLGSFKRKEPFLSIPITFSRQGIPCIEVKLEDQKYLFENHSVFLDFENKTAYISTER